MFGRIEAFPELISQHLPPRPVAVWLPPDYDGEPARRYPVLYAHDGQNLFPPSPAPGGADWGLDPALARLISAGRIPPVIVVGVGHGGERRWQEYMPQRPYQAAAPEAREQSAPPAGGPPVSDAYLRFLLELLKPAVDRAYRTLPGRDHTFVMGSSMGGLISLYALCRYPDSLAGAACLSTHWPAAGGVVVESLAGMLPPPGAHRLYFDFGTETLDAEYEPYQRRVDAILRAAGYREGEDWVTRKFEGAEHSERAWRERVHLPLAFLLGPLAGPGE